MPALTQAPQAAASSTGDRPPPIDYSGALKPTVARIACDSVSYVINTLLRRRAAAPLRGRKRSRSFAPADIPALDPLTRLPLNEVFFAGPHGPSHTTKPSSSHDSQQNRSCGWQRSCESPSTAAGPEVGNSRIDSSVLSRAFDNSNRRQCGMGIARRLFWKKSKKPKKDIQMRDVLDDMNDYRPYFTYWITTAQIIVFILTIFAYGFGPVGFDFSRRSGLVLVTSLSLQQVEYMEPSNIYIGPRPADLIHLGARYAPCMRNDPMIKKQREKWRERERDTACCIRNDDSGCVQSSQADCSFLHNNLVRGLEGPTKTISTWKKWTAGDAESGGRVSGSVCGLDPKFCENPASVKPHEWPDDITKWPICRKQSAVPRRYRQKERPYGKIAVAEHMACEVIGHPCCIGIHGTCSITTREYCDFVHGYFHEEASLCSQVSCMEDICGLLPFYDPDAPDQFYRLFTANFLHAGIIHLAVTLWFQLWMMRDVEKYMGPIRLCILYFGSSVAGSATSCMFTPYLAEVGPAGAHMGVLGAYLIQTTNMWHMIQSPQTAVLRIVGAIFFFFALGMLPWVDNFAHLFGILFGIAYTYILVPFSVMGNFERDRRVMYICTSSIFLFGFHVLLFCYFYFHPAEECIFAICNLFSCMPLTKNFCAEPNINFIKTGDV